MSRSIVSGDCPVDEAVHALATGFCVGLHGKAFSVLFLLKGFLLFAFYLLDTLFRCRKIRLADIQMIDFKSTFLGIFRERSQFAYW